MASENPKRNKGVFIPSYNHSLPTRDSDSDDVPAVDLTVRNGSSLRLRIHDVHVASYKPKVYWKDDSFEEVLFTVPSSGSGFPAATKAKHGFGLVINNVAEPNFKPSPAITFELDCEGCGLQVPSMFLQVELSCTSGTIDITYVVSLYPLSMATTVIVKNNGRKAVNLTSAI